MSTTLKAALTQAPLATASAKSRFYRPELDVLRFFAFMAVFVHHGIYSLSPLVSITGGFGLSLFFFLSAFLITELLQRERQLTGTVAIRAFYIRRILRIWPLYFGALGFAIILGWAFPSHRVSAGFVLSFVFMLGNTYIGSYGFPNTPVGVLWSISVEEQFYALWPILNRFCTRQTLIGIAALFLPLGGVAVLVLTALHKTPAIGIWTNSFVQFQMFGLGALLALALQGRIVAWPLPVRVLLIVAGCLLWIAAALFSGIADFVPRHGPGPLVGYYLVGLGCAAFILALLGLQRQWMPRHLVYLGKISYGLYVFHQASLDAASFLFNHINGTDSRSHHVVYGVGHLTLGLLLSVCLAIVSYRYFESPFLRLKESYTVVRSRSV
jgi:peptidoglycan/LPS O-acetylase OafA/YrhL